MYAFFIVICVLGTINNILSIMKLFYFDNIFFPEVV